MTKYEYVIRVGKGYNFGKTYSINGDGFRCERGRIRTHKRTSKSIQISYDQFLGTGRRYTKQTITPGTYEFRRNGNDAYLVKVR